MQINSGKVRGIYWFSLAWAGALRLTDNFSAALDYILSVHRDRCSASSLPLNFTCKIAKNVNFQINKIYLYVISHPLQTFNIDYPYGLVNVNTLLKLIYVSLDFINKSQSQRLLSMGTSETQLIWWNYSLVRKNLRSCTLYYI